MCAVDWLTEPSSENNAVVRRLLIIPLTHAACFCKPVPAIKAARLLILLPHFEKDLPTTSAAAERKEFSKKCSTYAPPSVVRQYGYLQELAFRSDKAGAAPAYYRLTVAGRQLYANGLAQFRLDLRLRPGRRGAFFEQGDFGGILPAGVGDMKDHTIESATFTVRSPSILV